VKNSEYWKQRFDIIEAAKNDAGERTIADVERMFSTAQRELDGQITTWYSRFADNNQISLAEARRLLNTRELAEFKWDVREYIKYGEQNALNPAWMRQLENASAKFHVSRLEALKLQTQQTMEKLFGNQLDAVDRLLKQQYLDGYYHSMFEIQRGFNVGWDIAAVNDGKLERILSKPWTPDKNTFSDRVWTDKTKLLNQVHTELTRNMILGKPPDMAINNLAKAMGTSKHNAGRLIMTESAYFSNLAQKDAFNELDVEQFEVIETLDSRTCAICGAMDGKVFPMSEFQAGVTAPPFHPWCRGCTVPYFEDDFGERAARDPENGQTHYVSSDMKFEEWKKKFVDGGEKTGLTKAEKGSIMRTQGDDALNKIPNIDKAVIPVEKFTEYALNPDKDPDKSIAFELALGYNQKNVGKLIESIKSNLDKFPATPKGNKGYGELYEVIMELTGENGKTAKVLTGWIDDISKNELRLITAHID